MEPNIECFLTGFLFCAPCHTIAKQYNNFIVMYNIFALIVIFNLQNQETHNKIILKFLLFPYAIKKQQNEIIECFSIKLYKQNLDDFQLYK